MNHWNLEGKTALVTGGSKGIGKATVREFLELGARVITVARSADELRALQDEFKQEEFSREGFESLHTFSADLSRPEQCYKLRDWFAENFDALDVLVNNVGTNIRKSTMEFGDADFDTIMQTNASSAWYMCRGFYQHLKKSGNASVINVSSITSKTVIPTSTAAYHMSKGAMDQLTQYLAVEWGKEHIRVNSVHPWYIETPLTKPVLENSGAREKIEQHTPLKRIGTPEEVARAVAFLAMDAASYISGNALNVDGAFAAAGLPPEG